ncbi:MAG: hybrid sensor histidine kinase/response regulator [Chloroflexota bacterium]
MSLEGTRRKLLSKFKEEADTHLLNLQQRLIDLERDPKNAAYIREIFRSAHTIKGSARMMGFVEISDIANAMEDIFAELREGNLVLESDTNDLLFEATDTITNSIEVALQGGKLSFDVTDLINRLQAVAHPAPTPVAPVSLVLPIPTPPLPLSVPPVTTSNKPLPKYNPKFKEEADTHLLSLQRRLVDLERDLDNKAFINEIFRAAHNIKGGGALIGFKDIVTVAGAMEDIFSELREGKLIIKPETNDLLFEAIDTLSSMLEYWQRGERFEADVVDIATRLIALAHPSGVKPSTTPSLPTLNVMAPQALAPVPAPPPTNQRPTTTLNDDVIRVAVRKLDDLMNIVGELVLGKMEAAATLNCLRKLQELLRAKQRPSAIIRNFLSASERTVTETVTMLELREALLQAQRLDQEIEQLVKNTFRDYEEHTSQLQNRVDELESNVLSIRMLPLETIYQDFPRLVRDIARQNGREQPSFIMQGGDIELDKRVLEGIKDPLIHLVRNALDHGIEKPEVRQAAGKPPAGSLAIAASQEGSYVSIRVTEDGSGIDPQRIRQVAISKRLMSEAKALATPDDEIVNLIYEPGFTTAPIITDISGRGVGMEIVKNNLDRLGGQVQVTSQKGLGTTISLRVPLTLATSRALLVRVADSSYAIPAPSIEEMIYLSSDEVLSREGRDVILHRNYLVPLVKLEELLGPQTHSNHPLFRYQRTNKSNTSLNMPKLANEYAYSGVTSNGDGGAAYSSQATSAVLGDGFVGLTMADPLVQAYLLQKQSNKPEQSGLQRIAFERLPAVVVGTGDRRICFLVDELVDETEIVVKNLSPLLRQVQFINGVTIMGDGRVVMILDIPNLINAARSITRSGLRRSRDKQAPRKRILVVDDSITTRELEKSILEAQGYIVELADDGSVALEMLQRNNIYDLIVSDVEMPHMNGFELTSKIKASPELRSLPVIIVSSLNSDEHKRRGIEAGAQAYITKGDFSQSNLLTTIEFLTV